MSLPEIMVLTFIGLVLLAFLVCSALAWWAQRDRARREAEAAAERERMAYHAEAMAQPRLVVDNAPEYPVISERLRAAMTRKST